MSSLAKISVGAPSSKHHGITTHRIGLEQMAVEHLCLILGWRVVLCCAEGPTEYLYKTDESWCPQLQHMTPVGTLDFCPATWKWHPATTQPGWVVWTYCLSPQLIVLGGAQLMALPLNCLSQECCRRQRSVSAMSFVTAHTLSRVSNVYLSEPTVVNQSSAHSASEILQKLSLFVLFFCLWSKLTSNSGHKLGLLFAWSQHTQLRTISVCLDQITLKVSRCSNYLIIWVKLRLHSMFTSCWVFQSLLGECMSWLQWKTCLAFCTDLWLSRKL